MWPEGSVFRAGRFVIWLKPDDFELKKYVRKSGYLFPQMWTSSMLGGRLVMFDGHRTRPLAKDGETLPLFHWKKVGANGETDEITVGPCAASIARWVIGLIFIHVTFIVFGS